jgi:hypothetical protein
MPTNHLDIRDRIASGQKHEQAILQTLNSLEVNLGSLTLTSWTHATTSEDKHDKIDAWALSGSLRLSAALKYRESGQDLGVALLRPWEGDRAFCDTYPGALPWDRDMQNMTDLYVCATANHLLVTRGKQIELIAGYMLGKLRANGGFGAENTFGSHEQGVTLKLVTDQGGGYSAGQQKVIAYIRPKLLVQHGAFRISLRGS